jgi:hypothetical protein
MSYAGISYYYELHADKHMLNSINVYYIPGINYKNKHLSIVFLWEIYNLVAVRDK